ncbi:hypothetical protein LXL04_004637 [Taraxacum kok-saghyz]
MSASRSKRARATVRAPQNPNHRGITFSSDDQRDKFDKFLEKSFEPTRFISAPALIQLHILDGVRALFQNIGWGGLFDIAKGYYLKPTCEFLSSVHLADEGMQFRMVSRDYHMSYDQLCAIISAPTDDTFGPTDNLTGYNPAIFWCQITRLREYVPKFSKSSSIIHPVLRVAHRILASIMFPRHETSTVNSAELQLLWCMTHAFDIKPNFGAYLTRRLSTTSPTSKGNICVGGLVTLIGSAVGVTFENHDYIPSTYLTFESFESMELFKTKRDGHLWILHHTHFKVNNSNRHLLDLADPITDTDWSLSEITGPDPHADDPIHAPAQVQDHPPSPPHDYAHYHQSYLDRFSSFDRQLADIRDDVDYLTMGLVEQTSIFEDFRNEQRDRWETQQQHERQMHYLMTDIHRALVLPRDHQPPQTPQWPPYYPSDYHPSYPYPQDRPGPSGSGPQ